MHRPRVPVLLVFLLFSTIAAFAANVPPSAAAPRERLTSTTVDLGPADPSTQIETAVLAIPLTSDADVRLNMLLRDQQDPSSPRYHQWLTPEQFAEQFCAPQSQIDTLVAALRAQGLQLTDVSKSRTSIRLSGTATALEKAFGSRVHLVQANSQDSFRFATPPATTFAGIPVRILLGEDLRVRSLSRKAAPNANLTTGAHALAPADWATIYNVSPIYAAGYRGSDSSTTVNIAIVGQSDIDLADVAAFQKLVGGTPNTPTVTHVDAAPGKTGDEDEGDLDVQWAAAIAPLASIRYYVSSQSALLAAQQAVNDNFSSVLSVSFGKCESQTSSAAITFIDTMWRQAASQGISVFVSSGDSGVSMCDGMTSTTGTIADVNSICSPSVTCVGGTQFNDTASPATYWLPQHDNTTLLSARGYIPEIAWNESGGSGGLASSGGGISNTWLKQSWQVAPGVPAGNTRVMPDIAANSGHVPYIIVKGGSPAFLIGTSAAAPSVAGVFGLIRQRLGRLGNVNVKVYQIGNAQYTGTGPTAFHDVTSGSNSVPGVSGYSCSVGYDLVTGLGSIDAGALMNAMAGSGGTPPPTGPCVANTTTACGLNGRFKVNVR
jgi:pseudomonalisin